MSVRAVSLALVLAGCGTVLPDSAARPAPETTETPATVNADIALASDTGETLEEAPRKGFLGGLFGGGKKDDVALSSPDAKPAQPVGDAVGEIILTGGVVARAPAGYCVDRSVDDGVEASRRVAIMASCERVSGKGQDAAVPSAVLTVTVGRLRVLGGADVDGQALADAFQANDPRAAKGTDGLTIVQLEKGGDDVIAEASPVHWRGVMPLGPRLVGFAVYVPKGSPLVGARGGELLRTLATGVRDASVIARRSEEVAEAN